MMTGGDLRTYQRVLELCKENNLTLDSPGMTFRLARGNGEYLGHFEYIQDVHQYLCGYAAGYVFGEAKGTQQSLVEAAREARKLNRRLPVNKDLYEHGNRNHAKAKKALARMQIPKRRKR